MENNKAHIFLDIDGVLHKLSDVYKNNEFKYVLNLYLLVSLLIRSGLKVDITISSARRLNQSIDDFKLALSSNSISKDIISMLNKKDIDTTCPEIFSETKFNIETESYSVQNNRFLEIKQYIKQHNIVNYVVFDDCPTLFFKTVKRPFYQDNIIVYLIEDIFGNKIHQNHYFETDDGQTLYSFDHLDDFEKDFNQRFISTYKKEIKDGFLDDNNVEKAYDILMKHYLLNR